MTRRLTMLAVVTSVLVSTALPVVAVPPETNSFVDRPSDHPPATCSTRRFSVEHSMRSPD